MLFYPAALPLSAQTLTYVAGVIRRHRRQIGSCWRKLNPGRQALLVLAYLRKGETFADLAAGFGVGTATAWRYVRETVALLAARSPKLRRALAAAKDAGHAYLVIDGTLIPIDRVAADRPFYSGKHRRHGMNLQVIASPGGDIVWVSGPLPGAVHDLTAARIWGIIRELAACRPDRAGRQGLPRRRRPRPHPLPRAGTSPPPRKTPTAPTPSYARPANAPTPSSRPGASCANSAAAPGAPGSSPRPSTSSKPARSQDVGSGAGAVALSGVRSCSHFSPGFPCGPLHCSDHGRALRFQPPPLRTVHAVLPHTAHRRRSPPAFGLSRQGFPALGATTIPYKLIRPRSAGAEVSITRHPKARLRRCFLLMNSASRIRA